MTHGFYRNAIVAVLWLLGACGGHAGADAAKGLLAVGADAPDFEATGADGKPTRLASQRGHYAVVYFYPKDETPGCTKEACAFRDTFAKFETAKVAIFGVSRDTAESHKAFREHHKLPFALAADPRGAIQNAYGVPERMGMSTRVTFLVGPDGKIARVFPDVNPALHADEVLAALKDPQRGVPGGSTKR